MSKKLTFLLSFVLVSLLAGNVLAADTTFTNGDPCDNNWNSQGNWDTNSVPTITDTVYIQGDANGTVGPLIDNDVNIGENRIYVGENGTETARLTVTGGTITTGRIHVGRTYGGTGIIDVNGCAWNSEDNFQSWYIGGNTAGNGIVNIGSGTIYMDDLFCPYGNNEGTGALNMNGGTIYINDDLKMSGVGDIHLDGGTIEQIGTAIGIGSSNGEFLVGYGSIFDITGGQLILNGDARFLIDGCVNVLGVPTGYGDSNKVYWDYDVTTPGKTTVWAETTPRSDYFTEVTLFSEDFTDYTDPCNPIWDINNWDQVRVSTGLTDERWVSDTDVPAGTEDFSSRFPAGSARRILTMADGVDTTGAFQVFVDFWCRDDDLDTGGDFDLQLNESGDPTTFNTYEDLAGITEDQWTHYTTILTDPEYIQPDLKIRFSTYSTAGEQAWIDEIVIKARYSTEPTTATLLSPADGAKYEPITDVLEWQPGYLSVSQDVYLGTNSEELVLVADDTSATTYSPTLDYGTTYYWRVDNNYDNAHADFGVSGTLEGEVQSFTTIDEEDIPADPNLVGWWKMDDTDDAMAWDYSGNGNHGTFTGDANIIADPCSERDNVLSVTGSHLECGTAPELDITKAVTMSAWFKIDSYITNGQTLLSKGDDTYQLRRTGTYYHSGYINGNELECTTAVEGIGWVHIASTYDSTVAADNQKIYINGVQENVATLSGPIATNSDSLWIGGNSTTSREWTGLIDDVRLYNRALSETEIKGLAGIGTAGDFSPSYGAITPTTVLLEWDSAAENPLFDVYLSSNFEDVNGSVPSALLADDISDSNYLASGLSMNTTYYWAVDANVNGKIFLADTIMSFTTGNDIAENPVPFDGSKYIAIPQLSWDVSVMMISQDVYFGTDSGELVLVADDTTASSVDVGVLTDGVTYYWKVDTTSALGTNTDGIWSFTAGSIADPNLVGWWKMDDATTAWDYSGYGHHGALMGTATIVDDPCGVRGNILVTDGNAVNAPYVRIDDFDYTNSSNECSLGFWFKTNGQVVDYMPYPFNHGSGEQYASNNLDMYIRNNEGTITSRIILDGQGETSATRWQKTATGIYDDSQWHYYTVTLSSTVAAVYVDGEVVVEPSEVPGIGNAMNPTQDILLGARDMIVGGVSVIDRFFDGSLDDVRMYNKVLSDEEIWILAGVDPVLDNLRNVVNNWLTTGPDGDLNEDGIVDLIDFNMASQQWGWQD